MIFIILLFPLVALSQLQNEDFATVSQLQARGLTNAQAKERMLHDTKVWITANSINKLLNQAIIDGDIGGGGGVNPNNLLDCPDFENCQSLDGSVSVGAGTPDPAVINRTAQGTPRNLKSYEIKSTASVSSLTWTVDKAVNFSGLQMVAFCEIKTSRSDVVFRSRVNGATESEIQVIGDGVFRYYEIAFVGGATSQGFQITGPTPIAGIIEVDNCYVGKASPDLRKRVGFKKELTPETDNFFSAKISASGVVSNENHNFINGNCVVTNGSTYTCNFVSGLFSAPPNCVVFSGRALSDSDNVWAYIRSATTTSSFTYRAVRGQDATDFTTTAEVICTRSTDYIKEPIEESTIVTKDSELTAKLANDFVAEISSSGVVSKENFDWINGNCTITNTSVASCNFVSGLFSAPPICSVTVYEDMTVVDGVIASVSNTQVTSTIRNPSGANTAGKRFLKCTRSTDYNKASTIVGKFENINSSDLVKVRAVGNGGQSITANTTNLIWSTKIVDNYNAWNGSVFTAPKSSYYLVSAVARFTSSAFYDVRAYINNTPNLYCMSGANTSAQPITCIFKLNKDDTLSFKIHINATLLNDTDSHVFNITELPDTESIVKNLMTQKTECQTKVLPADVTTTGVVSSLQFNNLTVGKRYEVKGQVYFSHTAAATSNAYLSLSNNSVVLAKNASLKTITSGNISGQQGSGVNFIFKAEAATLVASVDLTSAVLRGSNNTEHTYLQLCELPETVIETTKFN